MDIKNEISELLAKSDHESAFKLIVAELKKPLYVHLRRMLKDHDDAHDVLQETYIRVWKNLGQFKGDSKVSTWVYRIATNAALTHLEKAKRTMVVPLNEADHPLSHSMAPTAVEIQEKLDTALALLPPKQKQVFLLRYYDELSYQEIADITGTTEGALKASYHHAVKKIEAFLAED